MKIIHSDVDPKRGKAFAKRAHEIIELNGWDEGTMQIIEDQYRDLYSSVATILEDMREKYPDVHFDVYIGALRTRFPYSMLHMSTDRFLRDAMMEVDDAALNIKQLEIDSLPLPPGFKVTFEHGADHQHEDEAHPQGA